MSTWYAATEGKQFCAEAYELHNLFDKTYYETIVTKLTPYAKNRCVVDLGAADGRIGGMLENIAEQVINVDPYPAVKCYSPVIKMEGVEYLRTCRPHSLDLVFSVGTLGYLNAKDLQDECERVLKRDGKAIHITVSRQTPFFGHDNFNDMFFSKGWGPGGHQKPARPVPPYTIPISIKFDARSMQNFITGKAWSNLELFSAQELNEMVAMIPDALSEVEVYLNVRMFEVDGDGRLKLVSNGVL
mmetsp:Transcript_41559/g.65957  ORF Transcript_41559/g.65957 Transcript_41559/m.65957 type:complete len:243 (+) Transcript_41559:101-829(+)